MKNNLKGIPKVVDKLFYKKLIFHDFENFDLFFQRNLGWKSEFRQSSGGKLNILFQEIEFKSLSIYHDIINIGFITSGIIPDNKIAFYIPFEAVSKTQGLFCANSFDTNFLLSGRFNNQYDQFVSEYLRGFTLVIDKEFFQDYAEKVRCFDLDYIIKQNPSFLKVNPCQYSALKELLKNLCAQIDSNYQLLGNNHSMQAIIQETLLDKLTEILLRQQDQIIPVSKTSSQLLAQSAREFIDAHYDQPLTIKDICEAFGASERTLRYGFKAVFGINPKQYLKIHRLNIAHQKLLRSNSATTSVTNIAFDSGFWHLGRFSHDYKLLFEQSPSQTLLKGV